MIDQDNFVANDWQPHPSHNMTEWRSTIISMASNDRFASIRKCANCEAEEAIPGQSHIRHVELDTPCVVMPND